MAVTQKEQELKYELVAPVASEEKLTAITSSNSYYLLGGLHIESEFSWNSIFKIYANIFQE